MEIRFTDGSYTDSEGRVMLDPTVYKDWQIGAAAERELPPVEAFRQKLGLLPEELIPHGKTPPVMTADSTHNRRSSSEPGWRRYPRIMPLSSSS